MKLKNVVIDGEKNEKKKYKGLIGLKVVKKLSKKHNKREVLMLKMIEISKLFGYNMNEIKKLIKEFQKNYNRKH